MQRGFFSLLTYLLTCACLIAADAKEIPIHQIIEIDDAAYLVQMMQDADQKISYRTYPFGAINAPGFYKLANQVTNAISINSSDVMLDLGGQNVSGGIVVQSNLENIIIKDGTVDVQNAVTDAVKVNSGCRNITVKDVRVKNATISGIFLNQISESCIKNCEMTSNGTGMQISSCNTIVVEKCNALCSRVEGFSLVSSTTCSFTNCKAMSTGQGNQITTANIFGFVSTNGRGNNFEKCIANGTQGLQVTDGDSLIAGFALRGTESGSQIIKCESANATTSPYGLATPMGIWVENTLNTGLTQVASLAVTGQNFVTWSPDGRYVAGAVSSGNVTIYDFNRLTLQLTKIASSAETISGELHKVAWSPDNKHIAVACNSSAQVKVFRFNDSINTLQQIYTENLPLPACNTVSWSNDGRFFVLNNGFPSPLTLVLYKFNAITETVSKIQTASYNRTIQNAVWNPNDTFIAFSGYATGSGTYLKVIPFNQVTKTLDVNNPILPNIDVDRAEAVGWSPDGRFLAVGDQTNTRAYLYEFDPVARTLTQRDAVTRSQRVGSTAIWTQDGKYVIFTRHTFDSGSGGIEVFKVVNKKLIFQTSISIGEGREIGIPPDAGFIAFGDRVGGSPHGIHIYRLFTSSKNVIKDNVCYANSGGSTPLGIGISGSSVTNHITNNTCYSNPINPFMVETNYAFVTNVFNSLFQDIPTKNQNLGPFLRKPIGAPPDQIAMLNLLTSKLCDIQTKIELLIAANS